MPKRHVAVASRSLSLVLVALLELAVSLAIKDGWLLTLVRLLMP